MKILIFSRNQSNLTELQQIIQSLPFAEDAGVEIKPMGDYDVLRRDLVKNRYDLVIVAEPGAYGMEVCIGVRKLAQRVALVWFSDDRDFAAQSYRLNSTYFAELPVSRRIVANAVLRMMEQTSDVRCWG